jgi:hypothetical protein
MPVALTKKTIQSILRKKITGREYFKWSIISQLPNWSNKSLRTHKILQEIQKRRPAMMLDELLDKRERAPKQPPNAQDRKAS